MRRRSLWSVVALAAASLAGWYAVTVGGTDASADPAPEKVRDAPIFPGRMPPLGVKLPASEASGLIASKTYPGMYYWLRDGGSSKPGKPRDAIWGMRISAGGMPEAVRGDELFPSYPVTGAKNEDWEDLTVDDAGALWIGQLGANNCKDQQRLLRVAEPAPGGSGPLEVVASYTLRFPDNTKPGCSTYNSEALLWLDGHFYVFAKTSGTPVYRVDLPSGTSGEARLTRIGRFGRDVDNISAASISDDRTRMMVQDHERLWVFTTDPGRTGDDFMKDATSHKASGTARFEASGGASVEGGTFVRGTHDIAFVAEDGNLYYARPQTYGEPAWTPPPTVPPVPTNPPVPTVPPIPTNPPIPTIPPVPTVPPTLPPVPTDGPTWYDPWFDDLPDLPTDPGEAG
ncbi:hypothetical protein Ais01nite_44460 [Asanoa ishikariensis]|uniref:hypothetical protein n=1 Tax=Asanoa ishikariensis TaxID=137265 RepID=UPI000B898884|nr:hypothetical protein [Asanoa ishikariensis]GIF66411.1 hypothetical protein Ais01nite_44460 [Asanoa ishikariensis]